MSDLLGDLVHHPPMSKFSRWAGSTPSHWQNLRVKNAVRRIVSGGTPASGVESYWDGNIVWVTPSDISKTDRLVHSLRTITQAGLASSSAQLVPSGSLVITTRAPIGNVALADVELCTNQGCRSLEFGDLLDPGFAFWMFRILKPEMQSLGTGTTFDELSSHALGAIRIPVPSRAEQAAIVRFLDHADRRIRRAIRAKQKLITLLNEQKQAVIHQAVTRGLDVTVRVRPSGVDWLGNVPEHWEIRRSKRLFSASKELARPDDVQLSATQAFGVIPQAEYERRIGRKVTKIFQHLEKRRHVEIGDFVISMRSFQGGLERAWAAGCIRSSYVVLRPSPRADVGYFSHLFKSPAYIGALQCTANFIRDGQDLNFENFCRVDLPLPPDAEQAAIAEHVGRVAANTATATERARGVIALLSEYRTRLIADVVTGKLDVREAAARLPDEVDEIEPLDEADLEGIEGSELDDLEPVEA